VGAAIVVGVVVFSQSSWASLGVPRTAAVRVPERAASKAKPTRGTPTIRQVVQAGHTLTAILTEHRLSAREIAQWDDAMRQAAGNFQLSPGHVLNMRFAGARRLAALSYEVDDLIRVIVERRGTQLRGRTEPLQARVKMVAAEGLVQKNFF